MNIRSIGAAIAPAALLSICAALSHAQAPRLLTAVPPTAEAEKVTTQYLDPQRGATAEALVKGALESNPGIRAARLEIDKARARLAGAHLRPNPFFEFEQDSAWLAGDGSDSITSLGVSLPIEVFGQRSARIGAARLAVEASEAAVKEQELALAAEVLSVYSETLGALQELQSADESLDLDLDTTRFVQIRVNEGETPPLDLNLLRVEVTRHRSRRSLAEGRLRSLLSRLKLLCGIPHNEPLRLAEDLSAASLPELPADPEAAVAIGIRERPDILLARLSAEAAEAGLRLARAESRPDVRAYAKYRSGSSTYDAPSAPFSQTDRSIAVGLTFELPFFDRGQREIGEAEVVIRQASLLLEYREQTARAEIAAAFEEYLAASRAVSELESSAVPGSEVNIETIRRVYEIGEVRVTDLISERRRLVETKRELAEALSRRYRAHARIITAMGNRRMLSNGD
ncbi:MAG: TolC family protein [Acidobacteriota bacterium]|nr:MAG: TolC family protein [Acidobacteriota bacterium]